MTPQLSQTPRANGVKIVAAIPCFNNESFIADVVARAKKHADQVIVINDGSYDGTAEIAIKMDTLVINHSRNKGYGEAVKSCFEAAKANSADILVILDGDGQHNPDEIPKMVTPVLQNDADMVIGSRFLSNHTNMPRYRRLGIKLITFLFNFSSNVKVSDAQSGFRAYSKKIFDAFSLSESGMSVSIEALEKARRKRAIIKEVPISCFYAPSTLNFRAIKHGLSVALSVVRIRFKHSLTGRREGEV